MPFWVLMSTLCSHSKKLEQLTQPLQRRIVAQPARHLEKDCANVPRSTGAFVNIPSNDEYDVCM